MKQFNRQTGRKAEEIAAQALVEKGYRILERNWSDKYGEIDIVASDGETLVFVEVKAKTGEETGTPEEMVGPGKLNQVKNTAVRYLEGRDERCRIDVVAVVLSETGGLVRLTHYQGVD